ncbi:hypothetical protein CZ674_06815 [Agrococcus casei LMG 22410]|uniref:Uncharacterized protein n=1 Tax=Agrococcus casei LMG 22410 TaxID=1255656 RepID=A0A1R4FVL4_9MICO|nr:hypothetical protein CZ674_06815 [Agrococcus casei LMG 22410]
MLDRHGHGGRRTVHDLGFPRAGVDEWRVGVSRWLCRGSSRTG